MEEKIDRYRKLADYIYDDLSVEEAGVIEKEISTDPQWSDSYQRNRQVKDFLQAKIQLEDMRSDPLLEEAQKLAEMAFDPDTAAAVKSSSIPSAPKRGSQENPSCDKCRGRRPCHHTGCGDPSFPHGSGPPV
jgi:hypothetical protein